MKVVIAGAGGQVGIELQRTAPAGWTITPYDSSGLDISDRAAVDRTISSAAPDLVVNVAAFTAVDKAETKPGLAYAVNAVGAGNLARASADKGARLIHISTDFVFGGVKSSPYLPDDEPRPLNVYGDSKLAGEWLVREATDEKAIILRTSWVYAAHGNNFVRTMLRLLETRDRVMVVSDQVGSPTWAKTLAEAIWAIAKQPELEGIYHWSDAGVASWYDFAVAVQEEAMRIGLVERSVPVIPIRTEEYPAVARRPPYSVLDKNDTWRVLGRPASHWRVSLRSMLEELATKRALYGEME